MFGSAISTLPKLQFKQQLPPPAAPRCTAADCPRKVKADGTPLDQCGGCKRCYYCSKACQTADWKAGHKAECKTLRGTG